MKIRYASDLHVDLNTRYFGVSEQEILEKLNLDDMDMLILAGDTAEFPLNLKFIDLIMANYPKLKIIEIPGNHLYYSCVDRNRSMNEIDMACELYADIHDNYYFLNKNKVVIDGITFIGAIMWTKCGGHAGYQMKIARSLNDFRYILTNKKQLITPLDMAKRCENARKFICSTLNKTKGKCVVITHHAPYFEYCSDISHAFGINLDKSLCRLKHYPEYWIFGHTHINKDKDLVYKNGTIKCICNQIMPDDFKRWVDIDIPVGSIWQYVYDKPMRNNDIYVLYHEHGLELFLIGIFKSYNDAKMILNYVYAKYPFYHLIIKKINNLSEQELKYMPRCQRLLYKMERFEEWRR